MRHEKFLEPLGEAEPCGPDLEELGDNQYFGYVQPAEDKLPRSFFDGTGAPFDRSKIDLKAELTAIDSLLARTRDLRLLALEARFQILAGQIIGFCEAIAAIRALLDKFWKDVHPQSFADDYPMRQNVLSGLEDRTHIVLPLEHAAIVRDRKLNYVTYRQYAEAEGLVPLRPDQEKPDGQAIMSALASAEHREQVTTVHDRLSQAREDFGAIRSAFIEETGYENAPSFTVVREAIDGILGLLRKAVPELASSAAAQDDADAPASDGNEAAPADDGEMVLAPVAPTVSGPAAAIANHAEASAALAAAETYFMSYEPSAPALLLVHQARDLIGKPLIVAIEALLPGAAERTLIRFDGPHGFKLDIDRLRTLTEQTAGNGHAAVGGSAASSFSADTRAEASGLLAGVEAFYRRAEPSSPVAMLLARARRFLDRDFLAIVNEIIEAQKSESNSSGG